MGESNDKGPRRPYVPSRPQDRGINHLTSEASAADGELFGVYLEVEGSGVIVKLKGKALVNPVTGR
jgi:hypothetical protein